MNAKTKTTKYPGIPSVIHGNGAVAHVMGHVCGGVIGYPITPSTEIAEIYESVRADGGVNVWGRHPFFFSPEGVQTFSPEVDYRSKFRELLEKTVAGERVSRLFEAARFVIARDA